ncbi:hypothetical protein O9929_04945 [Vibrio lentus]|nr:hypothetical protein [Vibrio lentus]
MHRLQNLERQVKKYQLTAIGTSTGGPVALQKILTRIPAHYPRDCVGSAHAGYLYCCVCKPTEYSSSQVEVHEAQDGDNDETQR